MDQFFDPLFIDPRMPPRKSWRIRIHPAKAECFELTRLPGEQVRTLTLLIVRLSHFADDESLIRDDGRRVIEMPFTVLLPDGSEMAPLAVTFTLEGEEVLVMDVTPLDPRASDVRIAASDFGQMFVDLVEMFVNIAEILRPPNA